MKSAEPDLFDAVLDCGALFSDDDAQLFRYLLWRIWDASRPILVVCMLNPSRAGKLRNDPTVAALIHFARLWGFGGIRIINLYAFVSPHPKVMFAAGAQVGPDNGQHIEDAIVHAESLGSPILVAWGNGAEVSGELSRAEWFVARCRGRVDLICLGTTASGAPKHPMARGVHRIPRDQQPIIWRAK